jgi:hypothetical protein
MTRNPPDLFHLGWIFALVALILSATAPGYGLDPLLIKFCSPVLDQTGQLVTGFSSDSGLARYFPPRSSGQQIVFLQATPETPATKNLNEYLARSPEFRRSLDLVFMVRKSRYDLERKGLLPRLPTPSPRALGFSRSLITQPVFFAIEPNGFSMNPTGVVLVDPADPAHREQAMAPEIMVVAPIASRTVNSMMENDYLDLLAAHEMAHVAMFEAYGSRFFELAETFERGILQGHSPQTISHGSFALLEGWAEAVAAWVDPAGRLCRKAAAEARNRLKHDYVPLYYFDANDKIRHEFYLWVHPEQRDGRLKNASQILATEGTVAGILFDLLSNRKLVAAHEKILRLMISSHPANLAELIRAWIQEFPEDASTVLRVLLETTRYATMDRQVALAYAESWQMRQSFTRGRVTREVFEKSRKAYEEAKEKAFRAALAGADPFAAVCPRVGFRVTDFTGDLNLVDVDTLVNDCFLEKDDAEKVVAARETAGYFQGKALAQLIAAIGQERWEKNYSRFSWKDER